MGGATLFRFNLGILVAALGASLLVLASSSTTHAQAGTQPEPTAQPVAAASEFLGTVMFNGQPAPDGTTIEGVIGDLVCGTTTTTGGRYDISVRSGRGSGVDFQEGCGGSGANTSAVIFRSGALIANERGQFVPHTAQQLDLTFGQAPLLPKNGSGGSFASEGGSFTIGILLLIAAVAWMAGGTSSFVLGRRTRR